MADDKNKTKTEVIKPWMKHFVKLKPRPKERKQIVQATDDQFRGALTQMGMSEPMANLLLEMTTALNDGRMRALDARGPQNTTPTSFESFATEVFVPAYQHQAAA